MSKLSKIDHVLKATMATQASIWGYEWMDTPQHLSPAEVEMLLLLNEARIPCVQQHQIGMYVVDFWFPEAKLVVEIDGATYHQDAEKEKHRDKYLIEHGVDRVLHFAAMSVLGAEEDGEQVVRAVRWYLDFARKGSERDNRGVT